MNCKTNSVWLLLLGSLCCASMLAGQSIATGQLSGTVYGPLFQPVPNATVTVRTYDWDLIREGKTDGSGQFFFKDVGQSWVYCCATAPGLSRGCEFTPPLTAKNSPVNVDVRLFDAAKIRGRVLDARGDPVVGAHVLAAFDHAPLMMFKGRLEEVISDGHGRFTLPAVPLGEITVRASAKGFELGETSVYLRDDATVDIKLLRGAGRRLEITVDGVPAERLPDIRCWFIVSRPYPEPHMTLPRRLIEGTFDATGKCVIEGLPKAPALSMVQLKAGGMRFHPNNQDVPAGTDGKLTFRLDAVTGARPQPRITPSKPAPQLPADKPRAPRVPKKITNPTLKGELRDDDGKPKPNMLVRMYCDRTGWREAFTDTDGSFAVDAEYEDGDRIAFDLSNRDWVLVRKERRIVPSISTSVWRTYQRGMDLKLVATASTKVRGKLVAKRGYSVAGMRVLLEVAGPSRKFPRSPIGLAITNEKGEFVLDNMSQPEGKFWLVVSGSRGTAEAGPFRLKRKRELNGVKLQLKRAKTVTGTVVDYRGKPLPGARVTLVTKGSPIPAAGTKPALSNRAGRFAFHGMSDGTYVVEVRVEGKDVRTTSKTIKLGRKDTVDCKIKVPKRR